MPDQSSASAKKHSDQETIDLAGFVSSVPSPLTITLVRLSPNITWTRRTIEILSWKSSWEESWLLIAAWWALCLLVGIGKQYVSNFSARVLTLTRSHQAYNPCTRRRRTRITEMEIPFHATATPSHREPHSPHHLGPYQDPGVSAHTSKRHPPTPACPATGYRRPLRPVFGHRLLCPSTGHYRRHWNHFSDMEGALGSCGPGRFMG